MKKSSKSTTLQEIEDAMVADGTAFLADFQRKHGDEEIYAFVFELSAVGYAAHAAIATEESLHRFAEECADSYGDDLTLAKNDCRWAGPENGWSQSPEKAFRTTNKLLTVAEKTELYPEYDGTLEKVALSALKRMDEAGCFGDAERRNKILLGLCHTGGDNTDEQFIAWATQVNPASLVERVQSELQKRK